LVGQFLPDLAGPFLLRVSKLEASTCRRLLGPGFGDKGLSVLYAQSLEVTIQLSKRKRKKLSLQLPYAKLVFRTHLFSLAWETLKSPKKEKKEKLKKEEKL
jgi:hypothetical protein